MLQALHAFRDNKASFLLATPQAARGLDLPAVSHVYNLDLPQDAVTYLHRAGRAGRIGSPVPGALPRLASDGVADILLVMLGLLTPQAVVVCSLQRRCSVDQLSAHDCCGEACRSGDYSGDSRAGAGPASDC